MTWRNCFSITIAAIARAIPASRDFDQTLARRRRNRPQSLSLPDSLVVHIALGMSHSTFVREALIYSVSRAVQDASPFSIALSDGE